MLGYAVAVRLFGTRRLLQSVAGCRRGLSNITAPVSARALGVLRVVTFGIQTRTRSQVCSQHVGQRNPV